MIIDWPDVEGFCDDESSVATFAWLTVCVTMPVLEKESEFPEYAAVIT